MTTGFKIIDDDGVLLIIDTPEEEMTYFNRDLFRNTEIALFNGNPRKGGIETNYLGYEPVFVPYEHWRLREKKATNIREVVFPQCPPLSPSVWVDWFAIRNRIGKRIIYAGEVTQKVFISFPISPVFGPGDLDITYDPD